MNFEIEKKKQNKTKQNKTKQNKKKKKKKKTELLQQMWRRLNLGSPFKIHTPLWKILGKCLTEEGCEFSNIPTFCVIFRLGLSQSE